MNLYHNFLKCQCGEYIFPQRYVICIMTLLGVTASVNMQVTTDVALIKMIIQKEKDQENVGQQCPEINTDENIDINLIGGTLHWTDAQEGLIMAAFFPGYVVTQIFGGVLADKFGAKPLLSIGVFLSAIASISTPLAIAVGGWQFFVVLRIFMGLCLGTIFPSVFTIMSKWVPSKEQGILGAIITSGAPLGNVISALVTTALISHSKSWKLPFYVWGIVSIIWCKLFHLMCFSEPSQNPFMSEKEATMLKLELRGHRNVAEFKIPWKKILTSKAVLAMIACMVGNTIISLFVSILIPKYMTDVLKSDVTTSGTSDLISYMAMFISAIASGYLSDLFIRRGIMSVLMCRKLFCAIGGILSALFLILMGYMGCSNKNVSAMNIMCLGSMGLMYPSLFINPTDLSKNYAGTITSIANSTGYLLYFPWPNITAAITANHTMEQWRIVMWMMAIIGVICTSCFLLWGSSDRQDFDAMEEPLDYTSS